MNDSRKGCRIAALVMICAYLAVTRIMELYGLISNLSMGSYYLENYFLTFSNISSILLSYFEVVPTVLLLIFLAAGAKRIGLLRCSMILFMVVSGLTMIWYFCVRGFTSLKINAALHQAASLAVYLVILIETPKRKMTVSPILCLIRAGLVLIFPFIQAVLMMNAFGYEAGAAFSFTLSLSNILSALICIVFWIALFLTTKYVITGPERSKWDEWDDAEMEKYS